MGGRRVGALEAEVLERLWEAEGPLTVHDISARLSGRPRAYTTVMTILTRLVAKGLVRRFREGRSYTYAAAGSEEELAARAIREVLVASHDPQAVLARFVEEISDDPGLVEELARALRREEEG